MQIFNYFVFSTRFDPYRTLTTRIEALRFFYSSCYVVETQVRILESRLSLNLYEYFCTIKMGFYQHRPSSPAPWIRNIRTKSSLR